MAATDVPGAIAWHEGMMLAPQHFQELTRRQEQLLHYHASTIAPYHWGVGRLRFDRVLLTQGILRVLLLEAILPDGTVVAHHAGVASAPLERTLAKPSPQNDQVAALTVHLAVARFGGAEGDGAPAPFETYGGAPVVDETTGLQHPAIPRMRPRLRLLFDEEVSDAYVSFPLARVAYVSEGFTLTQPKPEQTGERTGLSYGDRPYYVPPSLDVRRDASPAAVIERLCHAICEEVREKANFLALQIRSAAVQNQARAVLKRHQVHSLVAGLVAFEAVLRSRAAHPFPLYLSLCNLVGHAAALGKALVPPVFPPYDHHRALESFERLGAYLWQVIEEGILQAYAERIFSRTERGFRIRFEGDWLRRDLLLGVRVGPGQSEKATATWITESLICTETRLEEARRLRVRGVRRRRVARAEGLDPEPRMLLFRLARDPGFLQGEEYLYVVRPDERAGEARPIELLLFVQQRTASSGGAAAPPR